MTGQTQVVGNTAVTKPNGMTLEQQIAILQAENAALKAASNQAIAYKCRAEGERYTDSKGKEQVGTGVLSMYGLGRFPVSLYESQWRKVIEEVKSGRLEAQLVTNAAKLAHKG